MADSNILTGNVKKASYTIILQITSRVIQLLNYAYVLRHVTDEELGLMGVRLSLLHATVMFLSREAFRKTALSNTSEHSWGRVINLLWLTLPVCMTLSCGSLYIWVNYLELPSAHLVDQYRMACVATVTCAMVELLCEPLSLVSKAFLYNNLFFVLNLMEMLLNNTILGTLTLMYPRYVVLAFSCANFIASSTYVLGFYIYFFFHLRNNNQEPDFPFSSLKDFMPHFNIQPLVEGHHLTLSWSFFKVGLVKHMLVEGEKYVMTVVSSLSLAQQGVYDVVSTLAALPAKSLGRGVEDSLYHYFSYRIKRMERIARQPRAEMAEAAKTLFYALRCMVVNGLTIMVFGISYSHLVLMLSRGESLTMGEGPTLMRASCAVVGLHMINSVVECFVHATMSHHELSWFSFFNVVNSLIFIFAAWMFCLFFSTLGLVFATATVFILRIFNSVRLIYSKYKGSAWNPLRGLVPGPVTILALIAAGVVTHASEETIYNTSVQSHVLVGVACFVFVYCSFLWEEKELRRVIWNFLYTPRVTHAHRR